MKEPHSARHESNRPHFNARQIFSALTVICTMAREWGEADSPAMWYYPDSSETATKRRNNGIRRFITNGRNLEHQGSRKSRLLYVQYSVRR